MAVPNESELTASTLKRRSSKIQDAVSRSNAFYNRLASKGNIKPIGGGISIIENVAYAENPNFGWYQGYDQLPLSPAEVISAAEWTWKQAACPVVISGLEQLQNSGENAIFDLLEAKIKNAEMTMKNGMQTALLSDGTGSGGKTLTGLDAAVPQDPTTGTYGGINRATATNTFWRSQLRDAASTITAATIQAEMTALWLSCTRGSDRPDLILLGSTLWTLFNSSVQSLTHFTPSDTARVGFPSLKFMDADVVVETGMLATDAYFLNTDYVYLRPHKDRNMVPLDPRKRWSVNQDAEAQILAWAGNLTVTNPALQGRLIGA